jgi:hypothetical protein
MRQLPQWGFLLVTPMVLLLLGFFGAAVERGVNALSQKLSQKKQTLPNAS